jgi:hypothetical protein
VRVLGQILHQRPGDLAHRHIAQRGMAKREHRRRDPVAPRRLVGLQIAELHQGMGQPRHRGLRQPGTRSQFAVGQQARLGGKTAQHFQAAGQRSDELAVISGGIRRLPGLGHLEVVILHSGTF